VLDESDCDGIGRGERDSRREAELIMRHQKFLR
jgi:hypothetical protein